MFFLFFARSMFVVTLLFSWFAALRRKQHSNSSLRAQNAQNLRRTHCSMGARQVNTQNNSDTHNVCSRTNLNSNTQCAREVNQSDTHKQTSNWTLRIARGSNGQLKQSVTQTKHTKQCQHCHNCSTAPRSSHTDATYYSSHRRHHSRLLLHSPSRRLLLGYD